MVYILTATGFFCATVVCHMLLLRYSGLSSKKAVYSLLLFPGMFVCVGVSFVFLSSQITQTVSENVSIMFALHIPLTAMILLVCMTFLFIIWILTPLLGEEGPTSMLLHIVRSQQKVTLDEIMKHFHDDETVKKRIGSLLDSGAVVKTGSRYRVSGKGEMLARLIGMYFRLISWKQSA